MIDRFELRSAEIPDGTQVRIYRNLTLSLFSVQVMQPKKGGKGNHWIVVHHTQHFCLTNVRFHVREGGRQRVLRERQKNVHAFVMGQWINNPVPIEAWGLKPWEVHYNPYKAPMFFYRGDDEFYRVIHGTKAVYASIDQGRTILKALPNITQHDPFILDAQK